MKIGKIVVLAMTICCLLIASSTHVAALEKSETIEDLENDVFDYETQEVVSDNQYIDVDNIDITQIGYEITNDTIEFTITVGGEIEDRGSLEEFDDPDASFYNIDAVTYTFDLVTSEDWLSISYANNTCRLTDDMGEVTNLTESDFTVNGNTLTVSFDWNTSGQTFEEASANVQYMRLVIDLEMLNDPDYEDIDESAIVWLVDQVPNGPLSVFADATNLGEVGESIEFDGIAIDGNPPYSWLWEFGDGETSTEPDPTHIYDEEDTYTYNLTVTDSTDESETFEGSIEIVKTGDDGNGTPGFELIIAVLAIGLIFLWKKKR